MEVLAAFIREQSGVMLPPAGLWDSKTGHRLLTCVRSRRDGRWAGKMVGS